MPTLITPVDLKVTFSREIRSENRYRINMEVIQALNIEFDVFVFDTATGLYSRVASVYDMETFPVGQELAAYNGVAYYRARGGYIEYNQLRDAIYFESVTKQRLRVLTTAWSLIVDRFTGDSLFDAHSVSGV